MNKIATHDSATGERGLDFLSWLVTPFARTQSKTIKEQYESGCRMFDIRVVLDDDLTWRCAHGIWVSKREAYDILKEINDFDEQCYVAMTYEGDAGLEYPFSLFVNKCKSNLTHIKWGGIGIKYGKDANLLNVKYDYVEPYPKDWPITRRKFLPLDGTTWHIILPIPWLWKKIYHNKVEFDDMAYTFVDFL